MTKTECQRCKGTGRRHDPTMVNYAGGDGTGMVECSSCRGTGVIQKLTIAEMIAEAEAFLARQSTR